ncbi:MAG TPA: flagellar biosynthesis protein FlgA, partial [Verrucomicrobiales bacterium]|nr:flagellar biosynthesis protein FlgA [Verrucomicrobiales bacterium]
MSPLNQFKIFAMMVLGTVIASASVVAGSVTVRDIATVAGARDNQLVGYGLVVGLAGDGDKDPVYAKAMIANVLNRFNLTLPAQAISAKNVAAVMVTADIPAFARQGSRIDVTVSAMGDAKSLQGGVLLQTFLLGADDEIYAAAQGPIAVGGFIGGVGGPGGATVQKNHPTVGQIIGGALVEREIEATIVEDNMLDLLLRQPDFTNAAKMAAAINEKYPGSAVAVDWTTVRVSVPEDQRSSPVDFVALLGNIGVTPDAPARIIINERTGTIVANSQIRIAACAVSHGNLTINVATTLTASQPNAFSETGDTVVVPNTETGVTENAGRMVALPELPTVENVAASLNSLGVTPRDIMA